MRKLKYIIAAAILLAVTVKAGSVLLMWNPNPPEDNVTGYKIYWSTTSQSYSNVIPDTVGNRTNHIVINLQPGTTYYFVATAYSPGGESDYSEEVSVTMSPIPSAVQSLQIVRESPSPKP